MENYLTFPISRIRSKSSIMLSRDRNMQLVTWNLSWTQGNVWGNPRAVTNRFITETLSRNSPPNESKCYRWNPCAEGVQGDLSRKVKNKLEALRVLQDSRQPLILSLQRKSHRILWLISEDCKLRSFILKKSPHHQRVHVGREDSKPR